MAPLTLTLTLGMTIFINLTIVDKYDSQGCTCPGRSGPVLDFSRFSISGPVRFLINNRSGPGRAGS